ncbi:MAG: GNAT family N-acyltransferase [Thioalkalivibrio sp.]
MFDERFEVVFADTESARRIHYQMRYHVYCLERGYEDPDAYPEGEEQDEWDASAAHFMVRHRETGEWLATLRLVLPDAGSLPVNHVCELPEQVRCVAPIEQAAEISRLCIWPAGRRLAASLQTGGGELLVGLLRAALAYSREQELRYWYFLISPGLARMVRKLCITLEPAGEACQMRGLRIPYVADLDETLRIAPDLFRRKLSRRPAYRRHSDLVAETFGTSRQARGDGAVEEARPRPVFV